MRRLEAVRQQLTRLVDGKPALIVSPSCTALRKALSGGFHYRRMRVAGTERFSDLPDKGEYSHIADALQYALLGAGADPLEVYGRRNRGPREPMYAQT
jgi:hypothetical protein